MAMAGRITPRLHTTDGMPRGLRPIDDRKRACFRQYLEGSTRLELAALYRVSTSTIAVWIEDVSAFETWERSKVRR